MLVSLVVHAQVTAQLAQSQRAMESLRSMQILASLVELVLQIVLLAVSKKANKILGYKEDHPVSWVVFLYVRLFVNV
jgi:hypothetical protein